MGAASNFTKAMDGTRAVRRTSLSARPRHLAFSVILVTAECKYKVPFAWSCAQAFGGSMIRCRGPLLSSPMINLDKTPGCDAFLAAWSAASEHCKALSDAHSLKSILRSLVCVLSSILSKNLTLSRSIYG